MAVKFHYEREGEARERVEREGMAAACPKSSEGVIFKAERSGRSCMAKTHGKGRGRKFRRYLKGIINQVFQLGTLATKDVASVVNGDTVTEKAWLSSVVLRWAMSNFTPGVTKGPILVGVAHSDYSSAEIEEWIENLGGWEEADQTGQEIGRRKIRQVGVFETPDSSSDSVALNDGKPIRTKCGWMLTTGQNLRMWAYNQGAAALTTTDPAVTIDGHCNLWPA